MNGSRRSERGTTGKLSKRGVWQAPWMGEEGEMVLIAITSKHRLLRIVTIPPGASRIDAAEALLSELDAADPVPSLRLIRAQ